MTETEKDLLFSIYEKKVILENYVTSDVVKRGNYFFVDVLYSDASKETNLRFDTRHEADMFQKLLNERYYEFTDETLYNSKDLTLTAFAFLLIGAVIGYAISLF